MGRFEWCEETGHCAGLHLTVVSQEVEGGIREERAETSESANEKPSGSGQSPQHKAHVGTRRSRGDGGRRGVKVRARSHRAETWVKSLDFISTQRGQWSVVTRGAAGVTVP